MMTHIYRQFERPHGALGALAGFVMSHRPSNRERNRWTVDLIAPEARCSRPGNRLRSGPGSCRTCATVSPSAASSDLIIRR